MQELINKGIEAARDGNRSAAQNFFRQAVQQDDQNEKAWWLLSRVAEGDDERRECLTKVLELNPANLKAQEALEKLEAEASTEGDEAKKKPAQDLDEEVMPGITRRQLRTVTLVGGGAAVVIVAIFAIMIISNNSRIAAELRATQDVIANMTATVNARNAAFAATDTQVAALTQTQVAIVSPTPTEFTALRTLPPTFTPTPSETPFGQVVSLPTPQGLAGAIVGWSGRDVTSIDHLPIALYNLADGSLQVVGDDQARYVDFHPNGQRVIYTSYDDLTFGKKIEMINLNGTEPDLLSEHWRGDPVFNPEMARYFPNDPSKIVFVGVLAEAGSQSVNVYILDTSIPPRASVLGNVPKGQPTPDASTIPSPLRLMTNDGANYSFPAVSPDGTRIVAVRADTTGATPGTDLVIIDIASTAAVPLTTDADSFIETTPRWSPDGTQIVYVATPRNEPANSDIVFRNADGSGMPILPARSPSEDIFPAWSPDGRSVAFTSKRNGYYDIYILDIATQTITQLTNTPDEDYVGGWWQP